MIDEYILDSQTEYRQELVGIKVRNLMPYILYTPEFIVLSTKFYKDWLSNKDTFIKDSLSTLTNIAMFFQRKDTNLIILRSSCSEEYINDRGKYHSETCMPNIDGIRKSILNIYNDFESQKSSSSLTIAIIIQIYKVPKIQGHFSNERRIYQSNLNWLLEEESTNESPNRSTPFTVEKRAPLFDQSLTVCLNYSVLIKHIKAFALWFSNMPNRYHIEWLWDGKELWLLQIDSEDEYKYKGTKPSSEWKFKTPKLIQTNLDDFEVLETAVTTLKNWRKIDCIKTFAKCKLPFWQIYILESEDVLNDLTEGKGNISLSADLKKLLTVPIVIRTETIKQDLMSPRTDTIFTLDKAISFLQKTTKKFISDGHKLGEFCFLIHQFIISSAGALSFTKPNTDITRIDSTWGIVEGLYYHPYDSFEFNKSSFSIIKKIRCKSYYIDVDVNGNWILKEAGKNFDWHSSLTDDQVKTIANFTQIISKHLGEPVNVMFFINSNKSYPEILPWFYTKDEISDTAVIYNNKLLPLKNKFVIRSEDDFLKLKQLDKGVEKKNLFINLNIDLCRNKHLIEDIADFAKANDYTVDIKGSMLSHPYYVFYSKGVSIRCIDPFLTEYGVKKYYKLVRDKIPMLISNNNEKVKTKKVLPSSLLPLLKTKIVEEANEFLWARTDDENIEEMSDILEVLRGTCKIYGLTLSDLEDIANKKREIRGGFEEGVVLIATKEQSALKLLKETTDLFSDDDKEINAKSEQIVQFFHKGDIDNLKSLTEVSKIQLPYVNNLSSKSNSFRYFLKDEKYNSVVIEYDPKNIILSFEVLTSELKDPLQLNLF